MASIHLIGICGTGMGSFAGLLKSVGHDVRGSDQAPYPPMSDKLASWGIEVRTPYAAENLDPPPDLVVVGNAIRKTNPEAQAVLQRELPYTSFPRALSDLFLASRHSVVIAGTHGKTTTSSMVAHILSQAGLDPSFLIGGVPENFGEGFHLGRGDVFVIEGDEYDTAFFDKRPKFVHYQPRTLVLTSLEYDHADIYPDVESIERAFDGLVALVPPDGSVVAAASAARIQPRLEHSRAPVQTYGLDDGQRTTDDLRFDEDGIRFRFEFAGRPSTFHLPMSGRHSAENAVAALLVAEKLGVGAEQAERALRTFRGVDRRETVRGIADGVRVIDDFAHHPTAVASTVAGLKLRYPEGRLWVVFEPRTATSARRVFQSAYGAAFDGADRVIIAGVGRPELAPEERLDVGALARSIAARGVDAESVPLVEDIVTRVAGQASAGDTVVFMSNGGFGGIHDRTLEALRSRAGGAAGPAESGPG